MPKITFDDFHGIDNIIADLMKSVVEPFTNKDHYDSIGISLPKGIVFYGPSGVGKTSLAIALANATGLACIYVDVRDSKTDAYLAFRAPRFDLKLLENLNKPLLNYLHKPEVHLLVFY